MATTKQLLTWVENTNKHGLGYSPETEWEMEKLAELAAVGTVIQISFHDGYRVPHIEVAPRALPLTPEQIADKILGNSAGIDPDEHLRLTVKQTRDALIQAATLAREKHISIH